MRKFKTKRNNDQHNLNTIILLPIAILCQPDKIITPNHLVTFVRILNIRTLHLQHLLLIIFLNQILIILFPKKYQLKIKNLSMQNGGYGF